MLTQHRLLLLLHYDAITGAFTRLQCSNKRFVGKVVNDSHHSGYIFIRVDGKRYAAHRLAWLYMTGAFPRAQIDHRNTIKADNRWDNLREATNRLNAENKRTPRVDNAVGRLGVCFHKASQRFVAQIQVDGVKRHLGLFDTAEEGHVVYLAAKKNLHRGNTL
jgi:hypothetical protein